MSQITKRWDVATARKYAKRDGSEGKQWINVGRAVQWDDGNIQVELNALPCFPGWDGKLSLFVPREKEQAPGQGASKPSGQPKRDDFEDEINF